jgi:hypothetical protein
MAERFMTTKDGFTYDTAMVGIQATWLRTQHGAAGDDLRDQQHVVRRALRKRAGRVHAQAVRTPEGNCTCCCGLVLPDGVGPLQHQGHLDLVRAERARLVVVETGPPHHALCQKCGWTMEQLPGVGAAELAHAHDRVCPAIEQVKHPGAHLAERDGILVLLVTGQLDAATFHRRAGTDLSGYEPENMLDPRHPEWIGHML